MKVENEKKIFFIVGAQRSGTTYLYKILDEHPQICMAKPMRPEPKYFINKSIEQVDLEFYFESYFSHCDQKTKILGEKSTSYYEHLETPALISNFFPNAKIIFILRNPVDRTLSNYKFNVDNGIETRTLREIFFDKKPAPKLSFQTSVDPFNYLGRGEYVKFIKHFLEYFPLEQIKVVIFEQITNNPKYWVKDLFEFLEVDNTFLPEQLEVPVNQSKTGLEDVPQELIDFLYNHFLPFNQELEKLLNKDLSVWRK